MMLSLVVLSDAVGKQQKGKHLLLNLFYLYLKPRLINVYSIALYCFMALYCYVYHFRLR